MEKLGSSLKVSGEGLVVGTACRGVRACVLARARVCVYVDVCVFSKLHITAQSGPVILVILCHSHCVCVCVCVCLLNCT